MTSPHAARRVFLFTMVGALQLVALAARADIPAGYTGTPYGGTPRAIPGRIELEDVDLGGEGVAYHADHRRSNSAGYEPISGNDYRPGDKDLPNICRTNTANMDFMVVTNAPYPSTTPTTEEHYIGYAHAVDWVKITVDVKQAGTYNVSSTWASEGAMWGLSIWFNDGKTAPDPQRPKDGVNKSGIVEMPGTSDYHKWKDYPNFTKVTLSAGLQVMTFHLERHDHLQYGHLIFELEGGGAGTAGTGGGAAGTGGGAAGTGGIVTGAAGTAATTGAAGTGGVVTGAAGTAPATGAAGTAATTGAAGTAATTGAAGTAPTTGSAGTTGVTPRDEPGGCACSVVAGSRSGAAAASLLIVACAFLARRRSRRS